MKNQEGKRKHSVSSLRLLWPLAALALILIYDLLFTPHFFTIVIKDGHLFGSLIDILNRSAPLCCVAIGMTLVIATAGIDISVGSIIAISGAAAAWLIAQSHAPLIAVLCVPCIVSLALGLVNGSLIAYLGIQPIVATLILMVAGRGIAQLITGGQIIIFEYKPFEFIANGFLGGLPFTITIVAAMLALALLLSRKTALGLFIESVGCNPEASRFAGINAHRVKLLAYAFCGLCAGIAGLIVASNIKAADSNNAGYLLELDAILAVVIGGTTLSGGKFSLIGAIIGALIIQSLTTTILTQGIAVEVTRVVKSLVVVAVFLLQSENFRKAIGASFTRRAA
jgi:simple sugar transport system permease protein